MKNIKVIKAENCLDCGQKLTKYSTSIIGYLSYSFKLKTEVKISRCRFCHSRRRSDYRLNLDFRSEHGLCIKCGKPKENPHKRHCKACLEKAKIRSKAYYKKLKEMHVCIDCGCKLLKSDKHVKCKRCRYNNNYYWHNPKQKILPLSIKPGDLFKIFDYDYMVIAITHEIDNYYFIDFIDLSDQSEERGYLKRLKNSFAFYNGMHKFF